jgi:hypothetical protein
MAEEPVLVASHAAADIEDAEAAEIAITDNLLSA